MKANIKIRLKVQNVKPLSSFATFTLIITTIASNQRCWYVLNEEKLHKPLTTKGILIMSISDSIVNKMI